MHTLPARSLARVTRESERNKEKREKKKKKRKKKRPPKARQRCDKENYKNYTGSRGLLSLSRTATRDLSICINKLPLGDIVIQARPTLDVSCRCPSSFSTSLSLSLHPRTVIRAEWSGTARVRMSEGVKKENGLLDRLNVGTREQRRGTR